MRCAALSAALALASCDAETTDGAAAPGEDDNRIECRPSGAAGFARVCSVDSSASEDGRILLVRKADGGFRRLRVTADGSGVVAADGAERTRVTILGDDRIEVEIGGDRFRLPARVRAR